MNRPTTIQRYIKLIVSDALSRDAMIHFFQCVKSLAPSGVLATVQTTDEHGALRSVTLVDREVNGKHEYIVPLSRDLSDKEVEPIVEAFVEQEPELDFDLEVSSSEANNLMGGKPISIKDDKYSELCTAWAKKQHDAWYQERTEAGWRYGPTMSIKNKTHPLLRQWHELPEQFRKIDFDQPQSLLDLLNDQGYAVIGKSELEGIMRLLRGGL